MSKPYEQCQGSRLEAREEYQKAQLCPDGPGLSKYHRRPLPTRDLVTEIGRSVRQLSKDYNAASCKPDGYEHSPRRGHSKLWHRSHRPRTRKHREPTKGLRDIFTRVSSRRYAPTAEKRYQQPELGDRIRRSSHYDWSRDACRVADRSVTQGTCGEMRSRSRLWEMFDNDQRRWMVPNGDCRRYVEGGHASGAKHQYEPVSIGGRQESRRRNHREVRQFPGHG